MQALWIVCLLAAATCVVESRRPVLRAAPTAVTTGNYVVILRKNTTTETLQRLLSKASQYANDNRVHRYVETVAKAFTLQLSSYSIEMVSHNYCSITCACPLNGVEALVLQVCKNTAILHAHNLCNDIPKLETGLRV